MKEKSLLKLSTIFILALMLNAYSNSWKSIGLDSLQINCLLNTDNGILAGTENGLYLFDELIQNSWVKITTAPNLPITDIIEASKDNKEILIAAGNGSNSDGIYGGLPIIKGSPYYNFSLVTYLDFPQSLAYYSDTLIIGSKNNIYSAIRDFTIISLVPGIFFYPPEEVTTSNNPFGIENPCVSDLIYSYQKNDFIAAGYDKSPEPAKGSLLIGNSKTMNPLFDSSTTSILEAFDETNGSQIFIGGLDGLYQHLSFSSDSSFIKINTPNNSKVNHVTDISLAELGIGINTTLAISTDNGIYFSIDYSNWTELGDIPAVPSMTISRHYANRSENILYAATDKGVYKYTLYNTAKGSSILNKNKGITVKKNNIQINVDNIQEIKIYNMSGKSLLIKQFSDSRMLTINLKELNLAKGSYILKIKSNSQWINKKIVLAN